MKLKAAEKPCQECPWKRESPVGHFPPERYAKLAQTACDMERKIFQCHQTSDGKPLVCAGFLERGADHNLTIRLAYMRGEIEKKDRSGGYHLYEDYREMAIANGVPSDHPSLAQCRSKQD